MKNIYIFTLAVIMTGCCFETIQAHQVPNTVITLQLKGKKYDQLTLKVGVWGPNHSRYIKFFKGQSDDSYRWTFNVPDSINEMVDYYVIMTRPFDLNTNTNYCAKFQGLTKDDSSHYNYVYDEKYSELEATFIETKRTKGFKGDENYFVVNDTLIIDGISQNDDMFRVDFKKRNTELELSMKYKYFAFMDMDNYEISLNEKDSISSKYPDSKYLMSQFVSFYSDLKNMHDVKKIYDNFSEKNKSSYFGKYIGNYIYLYSSKFENTSLTNATSDLMEPVIIDSTKFNLVIFSASWCSPCHKLIPTLKKVYNDLNGNLDMVYISLDEYKYVDSWKKLMKEYSIPWRSLLATGHVKEIEDKYNAYALPYMLLIFPDKTVKKIDIRIKEDKEELYKLAKQGK